MAFGTVELNAHEHSGGFGRDLLGFAFEGYEKCRGTVFDRAG